MKKYHLKYYIDLEASNSNAKSIFIHISFMVSAFVSCLRNLCPLKVVKIFSYVFLVALLFYLSYLSLLSI